MENFLDSLFPLHPNDGTLPYLVYQAVKKFGNQTCLSICGSQTTYCQLNYYSDNLAAFLRCNGYHKSSVLFVRPDGTEASYAVMVAGVKAGMVLIESNDISAETAANELLKKNILTFANGFFEEGLKKISFLKALEFGKGCLFFNIPDIYEDDMAFARLASDRKSQRIVSHKAALEMITNALPEQAVDPLIKFFYCLKNNCHERSKLL